MTNATAQPPNSPAPGAAGPSQREAAPHWQFSLRSLLGLTTAVAVAAAIAAARGAGTLVLSCSVILSALNASGQLQAVQAPRWRPRWVTWGWLLFVVSMLLPAAKGCNGTVAGWQCAGACVQAQIDSTRKVLTDVAESRQTTDRPLQFLSQQVYLGSLTLTNLAMALLPFIYLRWRNDRAWGVHSLLWLLGHAVWLFSWPSADGLYIGYYVWAASVAVVTICHRLTWRWTLLGWCLALPWTLLLPHLSP